MSPSPTDRRVRRTRQLLRDAFLSLMVEKGYDRITVQDILDRADVGRSTFYAHYRDKEDLLLAGFDDIRAALAAGPGPGDGGTGGEGGSAGGDELLQPLLVVFTHVESYRHFWGPISRKGGAGLVTRLLREHVEDLVRQQLARFDADPTELEAAVHFVTGAGMGVVVWWLDHDDIAYSADDLHALFRRLALPGLEPLLSPGRSPA